MHKEKIINFVFKDKKPEEIVDIVNKEIPLSLKHQQDLIDRIYIKYPYVKKYEIAVVVMAVFDIIRQSLILGEVINFYNLFMNAKLLFFNSSFGKPLKLKIKNKTSKKFG